MTVSHDHVLNLLDKITLPDGGTLISRDVVRALAITDGIVRFVVEAPSPELARLYASLKDPYR
jgi:ATP-binding protein involved in chromosome partitioning